MPFPCLLPFPPIPHSQGSEAACCAKPCRFFSREYTLNYELSQLRKPHIALIDGICMGGGAGVSMHGPFRLATERCSPPSIAF